MHLVETAWHIQELASAPLRRNGHQVSKNVPGFVVGGAVSQIRKSVKYRAGFDIKDDNPGDKVLACQTPAYLIHGADDDFILPKVCSRVLARAREHNTRADCSRRVNASRVGCSRRVNTPRVDCFRRVHMPRVDCSRCRSARETHAPIALGVIRLR
jgi:hypothetical protein